MKTVKVTKLGVGSFAKVVAFAQATIAFIVGLIATLLVAAGSITDNTGFVHTLGISLAYLGLGVVLYPVVAFLIGWVQGAIVALILNLFFAESGGLDLEIEEVSKK